MLTNQEDKLKCQQNISEIKQHLQIKPQTSLVILYHVCSSLKEAQAKASILESDKQKQNLEDKLQCKILQITTNQVRDSPYQENLIELQLSSFSVICLVDNINQYHPQQLQNIFNLYIGSRQNIIQYYHEGQYEMNTAIKNEKLSINTQIQNLNLQNTDAQITILCVEYFQKKVVKYTINLTLWLSGDIPFPNAKQKLTNLKQQIKEIFFTIQQIVIQDPIQIEIWNNILNKKYCDNNEYFITSNVDQNHVITILLKGKSQNLQTFQSDIEKSLQEYQCFEKQYHVENKLLLNLMLDNFTALRVFDEYLKQIFSESLIKIQTITPLTSQILLRVICKPQNFEMITITLQNEFINQLGLLQTNKKMEDFLEFSQIQERELKTKFFAICLETNQHLTIIGISPSLNSLEQYIGYDSYVIPIDDELILDSLKKSFVKNQISQTFLSKLAFDFNQITLKCRYNMLDSYLEEISVEIMKSSNALCKTQCQCSQSFIKYLKNNCLHLIEILQQQCECNLIFENQLNIQYSIGNDDAQERLFILTNENIYNLNCDLYINLGTGNDMKNRILEKLKENVPISNSQIISSQNLEFQFNNRVVTINNCSENLEQIIKDLFQTVNKYKLESLVIQFNDHNLMEQFTKEIINYLLASLKPLINRLCISEVNKKKFMSLEVMIKQHLEFIQRNQKNLKWQWKDNQSYVDYDEEQNIKINTIYQRFLMTGNPQQINLKYPYAKWPPTHIIDLQQMVIKSIYTNQEKKITLNNDDSNNPEYYINDTIVIEDLHNYIQEYQLKKQNLQPQIEIFLSSYEVHISQDKMFQKNVETNFVRNIRFKKLASENMLLLKSSKQQKIDQMIDLLDIEIQKVVSSIKIKFPFLTKEQIKEIKSFLEKKCEKIEGIVGEYEVIIIYYIHFQEKKIIQTLNKIPTIEMQKLNEEQAE